MKRLSIELDVGQISYVAQGQGQALVLLHSLGISAEACGKVLQPLAQNYAVYALDMLGHGYSSKPSKNYLIEDYAQSVIAFMDKLSLERAILCGNSVGALIALEIAATYPKRVEKLMLVGCPARDAWEQMERLTLAALDYDAEGNPKPLSIVTLAMSYAHPTVELLEWVNQQRAKAGKWVKKTLIAISLYDVFPKLPLVKCPTLILFGSQDVLREQEQILLEGIRRARYALVEDAGHLPQVEKPQAFLQEVNRFLSVP